MSAIGSGAPRPNTSRPSCGRPVSCSAALRIASSRRSRSASAVAMSSALGPGSPVGLRQQQARFQVGEPRRHHQIVGGELEPHLARLLDEGEILVGQRQDGDLREVDLLLARERQQQIERALEALDVDDQRRLVGGELGRQRGFERGIVSASSDRSAGSCAASPSCAANSSRAAATSNGAGLAPRRRAPHRRAAPPRRRAAALRPRPRRISSSVPLQ